MRNIIITGGNSGLGFETAKKIAKNKDYRIILACRNPEKAEKAKEDIINETGNENIETRILDTSSLKSVREFSDGIIEENIGIDVLINNAGISPSGELAFSEDGFELVFATNYLGHFLMTNKLLPLLNKNARILNITSDMHNPPGGIEWKDVEKMAHPEENDRLKYSYTKLDMIYFTHELTDLLADDERDIIVNSFNPGFMADTNFSKGFGKAREQQIKESMPDRYSTLEISSDALCEIAVSDGFADVKDQYFDRSTETRRSSDLSYDRNNSKELWDASIKYCGL